MESRVETRPPLDLLNTQQSRVSVAKIPYHGWPASYLIGNGAVEAIVVPAIGRVMQLRLARKEEGALWENRALDGQLHVPDSDQWINFGGDKVWPAPQSAWAQRQGHDWPPPVGFDSRPMEAAAHERKVVLTSAIDTAFGIQVIRHVELDAELPVMRIRSEFCKVAGSPVRVSVWTVTQMEEPERVFLPFCRRSKMPCGFTRMTAAEPDNLRIDDGLLSLGHHRVHCTKIGMDATSMAWVGRDLVVRVDAEAGPGEYPDGGCITQIYTSPNPLAYVELETLGPLTTMSSGDRIERTATYTILPRAVPDPEDEARKILFP
ncbi:MAG: DUF4380 domain-containing protein [Terracidiphilus sp.]